MKRTKSVRFVDFQRFLTNLGFAPTRAPSAWVFRHPEEGLLVFRLYREDEPVAPRDLLSSRKFLDLRGVLESKDFDAFVREEIARA